MDENIDKILYLVVLVLTNIAAFFGGLLYKQIKNLNREIEQLEKWYKLWQHHYDSLPDNFDAHYYKTKFLHFVMETMNIIWK